MEIQEINEKSFDNMSENELRKMFVYLSQTVNDLMYEKQKNYKTVERAKSTLDQSKCLRKELLNARRELKEERLKQSQIENYSKIINELNEVNRQKDTLSLQVSQLQKYKNSYKELRRSNRDFELAKNQEVKEILEKNHILELEIESLKKQNEIFGNAAKKHRGELAEKDEAIKNLKKQCWNADKEMDAMMQTQKTEEKNTALETFYISNLDKLDQMKKQLHSKMEKLFKLEKQLEQKNEIISELEMTLMKTKENVVSLEKKVQRQSEMSTCKFTIRKQNEQIQSLTAESNAFYQMNEKNKEEVKKLTDKVAYVKKLYFNEKMKNMDLEEALRRSETKNLPEGQSREVMPADFLAGPKQDCVKMQTTKRTDMCRTPILEKSKLYSKSNSGYTQQDTRFKNVVVLPSLTPDLLPKTEKCKFTTRQDYKLPPIASNSARLSTSHGPPTFMTEMEEKNNFK